MKFFDMIEGRTYKTGKDEFIYRCTNLGQIQYILKGDKAWTDVPFTPMALYNLDFSEVQTFIDEFKELENVRECGPFNIGLDANEYEHFALGQNRGIYIEWPKVTVRDAVSLEDMRAVVDYVAKVEALIQKIDNNVDKY